MENLHLHLEYLLRRHDCVTVPGLGAFIVTSTPAMFDFENGRILPPCREISFNAALRHDDGLLASSYARKESVSFEEGRIMAMRAVERLTTLLRKDLSAALGNVGQLTLGEEERISFTPWLSAEERSRLLGMEPLELSLPVAETSKTAVMAENTKVSDQQSGNGVKETVAAAAEKRSDKYYHIRIRKHLVHGVAAAMLVALVAISVLIPVNHSERRQEYASVVPVESLIRKTQAPASVENRKRPTAVSPAPVATTSATSAETTAASVTVTSTDISENVTGNLSDYYLIVATFRTRQEADNFIAQHKSSKWSLECVAGKKLFRVAAGGSNDRSELQKKLNDKSLKQEFEGAWVWKR